MAEAIPAQCSIRILHSEPKVEFMDGGYPGNRTKKSHDDVLQKRRMRNAGETSR